jgi:hypothetical protein
MTVFLAYMAHPRGIDKPRTCSARVILCLVALVTILTGCSPADQTGTPGAAGTDQATTPRFAGTTLQIAPQVLIGEPEKNALRSAYFGDLHVHTDYSFDAYAFGTVATPYDAYRYAKGDAIAHPAGFQVQLRQPLDFYAVTDHAMFLGAVKAGADTTTPFSRQPHVQGLHDLNAPENKNTSSLPQRVSVFTTFLPETLQRIANGETSQQLLDDIAQNAWADTIDAANAHYQPGTFTTFAAYEYTSSTDQRGNLHRNVIFRDTDKLPVMPFSRFHSQNPEGLWDWMDSLRAQGIEALAIPHNSNGSNGAMFMTADWAGRSIDNAYAAQRIRNEPLVEITQVKGTSETHPMLSPEDEWAGFEIMPFRVATTLYSEPKGSYARDALKEGLALADAGISNAYQFGFVGASDTHTGAASLDETNYFSKVGLLDANGGLRGSEPLSAGDAEVIKAAGRVNVQDINGKQYATGAYETWGASGLTGVWAETNTRDSIYNAFRRKETFATSGPRIKVRFFAGYDLANNDLMSEQALGQAYANGVSMGSQLAARGEQAPILLAWAARDPESAPLQRLQIIKGWSDDGQSFEQVYDVACADGGVVDPTTHRCPDNGATVDPSSCEISEGLGAGELRASWQDPGFDPSHRAFYYVRGLENPTCRWSTWDALRAGVVPRADLPRTIQERVWSSPIWFIPQPS